MEYLIRPRYFEIFVCLLTAYLYIRVGFTTSLMFRLKPCKVSLYLRIVQQFEAFTRYFFRLHIHSDSNKAK